MTVSADYRKLAKRYRTLPELQVRAGAAEMKDAVLESVTRDSGGDRMLSGKGRRPMTVTATVSPGRHLSTATVKAGPKRMIAAWSWLEHGTQTHLVGKPRGTMDRGLHMKVGGHWATGPWRVRGMPAKHTFSEGVRAGTPPAERAMVDVWEKSL